MQKKYLISLICLFSTGAYTHDYNLESIFFMNNNLNSLKSVKDKKIKIEFPQFYKNEIKNRNKIKFTEIVNGKVRLVHLRKESFQCRDNWCGSPRKCYGEYSEEILTERKLKGITKKWNLIFPGHSSDISIVELQTTSTKQITINTEKEFRTIKNFYYKEKGMKKCIQHNYVDYTFIVCEKIKRNLDEDAFPFILFDKEGVEVTHGAVYDFEHGLYTLNKIKFKGRRFVHFGVRSSPKVQDRFDFNNPSFFLFEKSSNHSKGYRNITEHESMMLCE